MYVAVYVSGMVVLIVVCCHMPNFHTLRLCAVVLVFLMLRMGYVNVRVRCSYVHVSINVRWCDSVRVPTHTRLSLLQLYSHAVL